MESTAAVLHAPVQSSDFAASSPADITAIEVAPPGPTEVRVELAAAGLCHTDLKIARGDSEETYPLVMGHEGAGVVEAVGERVTTVAPGDHVVLGRMSCGSCASCRSGRSNLCDARRHASSDGTLRSGAIRFSRDGGPVHHCHGVSSFTEYTVVDAEVAIPITDDVPLEHATLLGCGVFTGFGAVTNTARAEVGSSVAVFGCGGVGLSAVQGAAVAGANPVIAVDLIAEKLATAGALGATQTVDASATDPVERIRSLTDGGADYAVVCVGDVTAIEQAAAAVGKRGEVLVVGVPPSGASPDLDVYELMRAEKTVRGSFNGSYDLPQAIPKLAELVAAGALQLEPLISSVRPLAELNEAMAELEAGTGIRHVLVP
jgi:S-(hydroxymethyl)glutathione dehydrogenase/alcohol dehydrogenase